MILTYKIKHLQDYTNELRKFDFTVLLEKKEDIEKVVQLIDSNFSCHDDEEME